MIKLSSISQEQIKRDISLFIEANKDKYPVTTNYTGSVKNQIVDMASGLAAYLAQKYTMSVPETNLSTCKLRDSVYVNAEDWGYSVGRPMSPVVRLLSGSKNSFILKRGDSLGTVTSKGVQWGLIYFGPTRSIFYGQTFEVNVAQYFKVEGTFLESDFNKPVTIQAFPETESTSIDNFQVYLTINELEIEYSEDPRDLILTDTPSITTKNSLVDGEGIGVKAVIYQKIGDSVVGVQTLQKTDTYSLEYLTTTGLISNLATLMANVSLPTDITYDSISSLGMNEEDPEKVKRLAPAFYNSAGRAITEPDYEVIVNKHLLVFKSAYMYYDEFEKTAYVSYVSSSGEPLTVYEQSLLEAYTSKKRLAGTFIALVPATQKLESMLISCLYKCESKLTSDTVTAFEELIKQQIISIMSKYSGRQNIDKLLSEIEYELSQISLNGGLPMRSAVIKKVNGAGEAIDYVDGFSLTTSNSEAYVFDLKIELTC